jgi:hypothetical protein
VAIIEKTREELEQLLVGFDEEHARARQPLVEALEKLAGPKGGRRRPGRPRTSKAIASERPERRRRSGGVTRREQMLTMLDKKPGATSKTVSEAMGIASNYVYRIKGELENEGLVVSDGRKLTLTKAGADAAEEIRRECGVGKASARSASPKANGSKAKRKTKAKAKGRNSGSPASGSKPKATATPSPKSGAGKSGN